MSFVYYIQAQIKNYMIFSLKYSRNAYQNISNLKHTDVLSALLLQNLFIFTHICRCMFMGERQFVATNLATMTYLGISVFRFLAVFGFSGTALLNY